MDQYLYTKQLNDLSDYEGFATSVITLLLPSGANLVHTINNMNERMTNVDRIKSCL